MQTLSHEGLSFIERWEEFVGYVYDDKIPKRRINGVLKYPEWDGGHVVGTLTIGYGHTDAAGWPKIKLGMKVTKEEADEILDADLKPCKSSVNNLAAKMGLELTQGQFDALTSFTFNCGPGNLNKLLKGLTPATYVKIVPRRLMQYVNSKGERMQGLVNRRAGEVKLWNFTDQDDEDTMPIPSTAEREAPPKTIATSKSGNASIVGGAAGSAVVLSQVNDVASSLKDTKSNLHELGVFEYLGMAIHNPIFWVGIAIVVACGYVYWDRHRKLEEEHV